ncbi:EF-P beta-lysylation protein EpmB [Motilimonas pumila]|uniref:L-lysine 2,3-aminomutase n=1 Tax=Motilimonas pumila TaxID=2303987 RepID=A0A418YCX3_9GAMM|nr:EF-P beta-lysylation protein EpmB [Motilimonas pumila]
MQGHWQKELANAIKSPTQLLQAVGLSAEDLGNDYIAKQDFPTLVPLPFVARMRSGDRHDPLLLQVLPLQAEHVQQPGYVQDPLEEHDTAAPGLLHKYKSRVLLMLKTACAVNCRYCFRRHFPYQENSVSKRDWQQAVDYIAARPEINEVILSGGDPLMAKDEHLAWLLSQLEGINHLTRLRIHTRLPVVIPSRLTPELIARLQQSRFNVVMVLHINHSNEIDDVLRKKLQPARSAGIHLLNQAVLLKGINDNLASMVALSETLFDAGVMPYYLHLLDKVSGAAHFDTPTHLAQELIQQMLLELPGFLVPKLVREVAGEGSKTPQDIFS